MFTFKIGDKVKIIGKSMSFNKKPDCMAPYLGNIVTIKAIYGDNVDFVENYHTSSSTRRISEWSWRLADIELTGIILKSEISVPVEFYDKIIQLNTDTFGVRISRRKNFLLDKPIEVRNCYGNRFMLVGFQRTNIGTRKGIPNWILADNSNTSLHIKHDDYFYLETVAPAVEMTLEQIEAKLGHKIQIVKA